MVTGIWIAMRMGWLVRGCGELIGNQRQTKARPMVWGLGSFELKTLVCGLLMGLT